MAERIVIPRSRLERIAGKLEAISCLGGQDVGEFVESYLTDIVDEIDRLIAAGIALDRVIRPEEEGKI